MKKCQATSAQDCGCGCASKAKRKPAKRRSRSAGSGARRDFAPIRKIKKKIAIFRLKLALRSLWNSGRTVTQKAKNIVTRAREVAIVSGLTPEQVDRIEQEIIRLARKSYSSARQAATERILKPARTKAKQLTVRATNVYAARDPARCSMGTEIQTLVLSQQLFNERQAIGWVKRHGFRVSKVDVTPNNYRFRQHPPTNFQAGSFRTIRLRPGVQAVIGCPQ